MTIPLYISVATIALSFFFPGDKEKSSSSATSTPAVKTVTSRSSSTWRDGRHAFTIGLVIGSGLSMIISTEIKRRRILERCRHAFLKWIEDDEENAEHSVSQKPKPVKSLHGTSLVSDGGNDCDDNGLRRTLVSPDSTITSSLNVDILEIPQGKHLVQNYSIGVECYYVIQGSGICFLNGTDENSMCEGEAFVLEPGNSREIKNTGRQLLKLIRATDATCASGDGIEPCMQSTILSNFSSIIHHGKVGALGILKGFLRSTQKPPRTVG